MTSNSEPDAGDNLQFDRAEFEDAQAAGVVCSSCQQAITDWYYEINGLITCATCHAKVREAFFGGSRLRRAAMATVFGIVAGVLGAAIYYGVAAATGYEIGLVAIVVGLLVGGAVRRGSGGRGGWFYQLMAVALTYSAISGSYFIFAAKEFAKQEQATSNQVTESAPADSPPALAGATSQPAAAAQADDASTEAPSPAAFLLAFVLVLGLALALPILVGIESPITFLIIGFALYEAWVINKRPALQINGPCRIGDGVVPAANAPVAASASADTTHA
ncbi:MAG TPA: hypothetical protein PK184_01485 [Phycisphaerae bacterium]|jgi:hypothetical protein|nr:hypothetical protein [Phycisphaerae bacterium]HQA43865.1 hypothetical protein [Phycisphaerae bacterium]HQE41626.1 hypothetical protein [Phycisphaerae bacterium]